MAHPAPSAACPGGAPAHLSSMDDETSPEPKAPAPKLPPEVDGPKGPEPTRYGDWEQKGRCTDF